MRCKNIKMCMFYPRKRGAVWARELVCTTSRKDYTLKLAENSKHYFLIIRYIHVSYHTIQNWQLQIRSILYFFYLSSRNFCYLVTEKQHCVLLQHTDKPYGRNSTVLCIGVKFEYRP
jgi:hypothetical protein